MWTFPFKTPCNVAIDAHAEHCLFCSFAENIKKHAAQTMFMCCKLFDLSRISAASCWQACTSTGFTRSLKDPRDRACDFLVSQSFSHANAFGCNMYQVDQAFLCMQPRQHCLLVLIWHLHHLLLSFALYSVPPCTCRATSKAAVLNFEGNSQTALLKEQSLSVIYKQSSKNTHVTSRLVLASSW